MKKDLVHLDCKECNSRHASIFCKLTSEQLDMVNEHKTLTKYRKKMPIFSQGNFPHGIYTVSSGKVKVYQLTDGGKEQIVRLAKTGDVLGYRALITGEKYSCTAETIENSSICFIPKSTFFHLVEENPDVSGQLLKLLSSDLKKAEHKITDLVQKPVRERLAEALLVLKETYGLEKDNATLNVVLTRAEIANIAGTATETTIRLLSELKDEGIVEFIGKHIKILDLKKLISAANVYD